MRLLVTGAAGMLGTDVVAAARRAGHDTTALARAQLDITDPVAVANAVASARPDAVVNCAAWTDVDGAESNEAEAIRINGDGPKALARACGDHDVLLVHVGSDYVFPGDGAAPLAESAATGPRSAYGRSKLAGDEAIQAVGARAAIVRSSWLFGVHGGNFVATMLRLGRERDELTVVDDQRGCPTYTGHLANALVDVAERGPTGVLHVAGGGECSWYDLAQATFERAGLTPRLLRGATADLDRPAPRPSYSVLATERDDAPRLPHWSEGLDAYLTALEVRA